MRDRNKVVELARSWIGKKESDGSYKTIIDTYNSYKGTLPRGIKMDYSWPWCACTWSAIAIKLGYTDIMPIEISCGNLIDAAKKMGCWQEDDAYIPSPGDAILYDWDDDGKGGNVGWPDHVGVVENVVTSAKTITAIEGNYNNSVKRRTMAINGKYIRGFITPKYDKVTTTTTTTAPSSDLITAVAKDVIAGKYGNGDDRKKNIEKMGYDYNTVQAAVNALLKQQNLEKVAKDVIAGKYGNGDDRKKNLEKAGYDYNAVQTVVNNLLKKG